MGNFKGAKRYLDIALEYYRRNDMVPYLARVLRVCFVRSKVRSVSHPSK
jgi:hypothetical protein